MERETFQHHWNCLKGYLWVLHYYLKSQLYLKLNLCCLYMLSPYHSVHHYLQISVIVSFLALGEVLPYKSTNGDVVPCVPGMYILTSQGMDDQHALNRHMLCINFCLLADCA